MPRRISYEEVIQNDGNTALFQLIEHHADEADREVEELLREVYESGRDDQFAKNNGMTDYGQDERIKEAMRRWWGGGGCLRTIRHST